jgi:DNA processing protein
MRVAATAEQPGTQAAMDSTMRLRVALAATRPHAGREAVRRVRRDGPDGLVMLYEKLDREARLVVDRQADDLVDKGIRATILGTPEYPRRLGLAGEAPLILFYRGNLALADRPSIGICGSRNVSDVGLRVAYTCGELAAKQGIASVSGYARGVDMATHIASLNSGAETVIVLPEGIDHFRIKRDIAKAWRDERALVVSQFSPRQPWSAGGAMTRNSVIIGLSMALIVVEAGDRGGTLAAGKKALKLGRRVLALEFGATPVGNKILLNEGAISVTSCDELATFINELRNVVDEMDLPNSQQSDQDFLL